MIFGTSSLNKLVLALFLGLSSVCFAQEQNSLQVPSDSTIKKDSTKNISILVVPFNPAMYFSDADKDISEQSQLEQGKVKDKFSGSLEATLAEHIGLYYDTKSISKQAEASDDLDIIFGSIHYKPEKKEIKPKEEKPSNSGSGNSILKGLKKKIKEATADSEEETPKEDYMNISFDDNRLVKLLSDKYKSDYILFINQFEVKTDYKNCIDLSLRKYYREIKVHYTLISKDGKQMSGNVITLPYHSNENNLQSIVKDNFGTLAGEILQKIYTKK